MMKSAKQQSGASLIISLIMLIVLTLMVVSSISVNNTSMKIVGNLQSQHALDNAAQEANATIVGSFSNFTVPVPTPPAMTVNGYSVTVAKPVCKKAALAFGYQFDDPLAPEDTNWELQANATDSLTGSTTAVHNGVKIRLPAGNCP
ncbi:MAG: hypothetical protein ABI619_03940 [Betaproteobacteria bacterium]